MLMICWFNWCR